MNLTRNNYESWFIDYIDGTLSAEQRAELLLFLEQHPDLKAEFESFVNEPLPEMEESLPGTFVSSLRRGDIDEHNLSYYLIASMEGDLTGDEQKRLDQFLSTHPHLQQQQRLVSATRLEAVEEVYPGKANLKQPVPMVFSITRAVKYAVAAVLLLAVVAGSYVIYTKTVSTSQVQLAVEQSAVEQSAVEQSAVGSQQQSAVGSQQQSAAGGQQQLAAGGQRQAAAGSQQQLAAGGQQQSAAGSQRQAAAGSQRQLAAGSQHSALPMANKTVPDSPQRDMIESEQMAVESAPLNENTVQQTVEPEAPVYAVNEPEAAKEEYVSVWDAIRGSAGKRAQEFAGHNAGETTTSANRRTRPRLIDLVGKGVEKITGDKVQYNSAYDENGNLSALNVSTGKFGIERVVE
jgi:hypothetical protein